MFNIEHMIYINKKLSKTEMINVNIIHIMRIEALCRKRKFSSHERDCQYFKS